MRWELEDNLDAILNKNDEVEKLSKVEVCFNDDILTHVLVEMDDGSLLSFCSTETDHDGCRKGLCVTMKKGTK